MDEVKTGGMVAGGVARATVLVDLAGAPASFRLKAAYLRGKGDEETAAWLERRAVKLAEGLSEDRPRVRLKAGEATVLVERLDIDGLGLRPNKIAVLGILARKRLGSFSVDDIVHGAALLDLVISPKTATRIRTKLIELDLAKPVDGKDGVTITTKGLIAARELGVLK